MLYRRFLPYIKKHWDLPVGLGAGFMAGLAFLLGWPIVTAISLLLALCGLAQRSFASLLALGGGYMVGSSVWFFPGTEGPVQLFAAIVGTFVIGVVFHGLPHLLLKRPIVWILWPFAITASEYIASLFGLVGVPLGLVALHTPIGSLATIGSLTDVSVAFAIILILPMAHKMLIVPAIVLFVGMYWFGLPIDQKPFPVQISYIQHDPPAKTKWHPDVAALILKDLNERTTKIGETDLIVWTENAVTTTFDIETALSQIEPTTAPLLFGMTRYRESGKPDLLNSAILRTDDQIQISNKQKLVPMIEDGLPWISLPSILPAERQTFTLPNGQKFLTLLCYEVSFSIPKEDLTDVSFIVVISAETGLFRSMTKQVYDNMAIARSLETGLPILRVGDAT